MRDLISDYAMDLLPTQRDPRVDPKAGDIIRNFGGCRRGASVTVLDRDGDMDSSMVTIKPSSAKSARIECLAYFRRAAARAEVIHAAG